MSCIQDYSIFGNGSRYRERLFSNEEQGWRCCAVERFDHVRIIVLLEMDGRLASTEAKIGTVITADQRRIMGIGACSATGERICIGFDCHR